MAVAERPADDTVRPSEGWRRDKDAEFILAENGMGWEYVTIPFNLIDRQLSLLNNARMTALDHDEAELYAADMGRGDAFPALVLFPQPDGTYQIASGNHRAHAADRSGRKTIDAYIVPTNDITMRSLLTQTFNKRHGIRPPQGERINQALKWMADTGRAPSYVALRFGVPESSLRRVQRENRRRQRFDHAGVPFQPLRKRTQELIDRIPNDPAMVRAAHLVLEAKLPDSEVQLLVDRVAEQRSESGQIAAVERYAERDDIKQRRAEVAGGSKRRASAWTPAARLRAGLNGAMKEINRNPSRLALGLTNDEDYQAIVTLAESIWERLAGLPDAVAPST